MVRTSFYLPVLSVEQNDSQSEEIIVIYESQAENGPVPVQVAQIICQKVSLIGHFDCCIAVNLN